MYTMAAASSLKLISKRVIKPSSPTPSHLKSYNLSLNDQLISPNYIPISLFYPNHQLLKSPNQLPQLLEKSLSKLLTSYYPFAGTLKDNVSLDCSDRGATFVEARAECPMSEILAHPDPIAQDIVYPTGLRWNYPSENDSPVVVQLTHFSCGGISLAVCLTHKLADGATLMNFMKDWASTTGQYGEDPAPHFIGASLFPPSTHPDTLPMFAPKEQERVGRRLVFDCGSIARLKALVAEESQVQNPTRVEVVTALLYKYAMAASTSMGLQQIRPSHLLLMANLRPLPTPPLPLSAVGNMVYILAITIDEGDLKLSRLVSELRRKKVELQEKCKSLKPEELYPVSLENLERMKFLQDGDSYMCTSFCGYPTYELDFGWGQPMRVDLGALPLKNTFLLMDGKNENEVVAQVNLDEKVMPIFENDKDILTFASFNSTF